MLYRYRGVNNQGKRVSGTIEASGEGDAIARLKGQGIFHESLAEKQPSVFSRISLRKKEAVKNSFLSTLSRDLSIYLKAGISIVNSIRLGAASYTDNKKAASFLQSVATYLEEGKSFSQALELQEVYDIPFFYRQTIRISEDGGILSEVLDEMARFLKEQERLAKQVRNAMFYPLFILTVSILMVSFMITVVVPKITGIFDQMGQELPGITKVVIGSSDFFGAHWPWLAGGFVGIIVGFGMLMRFNKAFKYTVDFFLLKLPVIGKVVEASELARFTYMTSVLLRSGVPFVQAIKLAANILNNSVLSTMFETSAERVVEGGKLSSALHSRKGYKIDPAFVKAVALGEETSELQSILSNLSLLYFEENKDRIAIFLSLLEPVLMLAVGGIIGFIVTAMLLPIFSIQFGG